MSADPTEDTRIRMQELPTVGCQVVIGLGPASSMDIANRLEDVIPPVWRIDSEFHRTRDDGTDIFFHNIETQNDRVRIPVLERFGDQFTEVKRQQSIEMAREQSPDLFDEAVETLGREGALEMFADFGISDDTGLRLFARPREEVPVEADVEVFLRVKMGAPVTDNQMENIVKREFMGELVRVERDTTVSFLIGGEPADTVGQVRQTLDRIGENAPVERDESAVVCRVSERRPG